MRHIVRLDDVWTRRKVVSIGSVMLATLATASTEVALRDMIAMGRDLGFSGWSEGRLVARPGHRNREVAPGLHRLGLDRERDALLYVPAGYQPHDPAPFVLALHGAGGVASSGLYPLQALADEAGLVLLSPASRGRTWDVILGAFGPDIDFIDQALVGTFGRCAIDPTRMAVSGFSDGASYALSIGITNGDLFPHVIAFSPGFAAPADQHGEPRLFLSHGTEDEVLAIDRTSRRLVPELSGAGYPVEYVEFDGGHSVPEEIARRGLAWFFDGAAELAATPES